MVFDDTLVVCLVPLAIACSDSDRDSDGATAEIDCDDADPNVYPGAPDVVGDGIDADCDGSDAPSVGLDRFLGAHLSPSDGYVRGGFVLAASDLGDDGRGVVLAGSQAIHPQGASESGFAWLLDGATMDVVNVWEGPQPGSVLGLGVGIGRLWIGETGSAVLMAEEGVYVDTAPSVSGSGASQEMFFVDRMTVGVAEHMLVSAVGGDENASILLHCSDATHGSHVRVLGESLLLPFPTLEAANVIIHSSVGFNLGSSIATADFDGDGVVDVGIGDSAAYDAAGVFHRVDGSELQASDVELDLVGESAVGEATGDWLGEQAVGVGDVDNDGRDEFVVDAMAWPAGERRGRVYVFGLDMSNTDSAVSVFDGEMGVQHFGRGMSSADVDGDGQQDLALGAPSLSTLDSTKPGRVMLFFGPIQEGHHEAAEADAAWGGEAGGDMAGWAIAGVDVDGDGRSELAIGAPGFDAEGVDSGTVYLVSVQL